MAQPHVCFICQATVELSSTSFVGTPTAHRAEAAQEAVANTAGGVVSNPMRGGTFGSGDCSTSHGRASSSGAGCRSAAVTPYTAVSAQGPSLSLSESSLAAVVPMADLAAAVQVPTPPFFLSFSDFFC